ncbi:MAG: alpha-D-ribose 1-methylphosphonate 5-triphosphate diphosphatase [Pseudomonadota bacterium]
MLITFEGAQVILPDQVVETSVTIADGAIADIGGPARGDIIKARGLYLAPALIDVHGDAFERQLMPRPDVFFPIETATIDTDRQLATNGIATAYHAVTLSWEPGLRSVERGRLIMQTLLDLAPRLTVENRVQLRWETFAFEALDLMEWALQTPLAPSIAFNDHTSMTMRAYDVGIQDRAFEHSPDFSIADLDDERMKKRVAGKARRAGLSDEDYIKRLDDIWQRRANVQDKISDVAAIGRAASAPMLSHDDTRTETREYFRSHGVTVAEFPMVLEAAQSARDSGEPIIFGAPNAARGGSHIGSLSAADMVEDGFCNALASDYFYPSMLAAVARLHAEKRRPIADLWALVSEGPARAMKLDDRGKIAKGKRADLVLIDWPQGATPSILGTWVSGRCAYRGMPRV